MVDMLKGWSLEDSQGMLRDLDSESMSQRLYEKRVSWSDWGDRVGRFFIGSLQSSLNSSGDESDQS